MNCKGRRQKQGDAAQTWVLRRLQIMKWRRESTSNREQRQSGKNEHREWGEALQEGVGLIRTEGLGGQREKGRDRKQRDYWRVCKERQKNLVLMPEAEAF